VPTSYTKAQAQDPVFAAARFQRDAVLERSVQSSAALGPSLNLNANTSRQSGQASFNSADYTQRTVRNNAWNFQLSQPLWRRGLQVASDQAALQVQQSEEVFRQASTI
jgi:outer membrane protein TolC